MSLSSGTGVRGTEHEERRRDMKTFIFLSFTFPGSHFCLRKGLCGVRNILVERQDIWITVPSVMKHTTGTVQGALRNRQTSSPSHGSADVRQPPSTRSEWRWLQDLEEEVFLSRLLGEMTLKKSQPP